MTTQKDLEEIKTALYHYLETYFLNRDLEGTLPLLRSTITGFGTGQDEIGFDKKAFEALYTRDISQGPNPITYTITAQNIASPIKNIGITTTVLDIETTIFDQQLKLNGLRLSMVFAKHGDQWLAEHMHISLPTEAHEEDESFPVKELEDRNILLQKMVEKKTQELETAIEDISVLAKTDALTGIYNRLKLDELLKNEIERTRRYGRDLAISLLDIDHFKQINDRHGHLIGDQVLKDMVDLIANRLRKTDLFGRWGGEEFLIIFPETSLENAASLANELRQAIESHKFSIISSLTASFGVSIYKPGETASSLLTRVDHALYEAKRNGRNKVESK